MRYNLSRFQVKRGLVVLRNKLLDCKLVVHLNFSNASMVFLTFISHTTIDSTPLLSNLRKSFEKFKIYHKRKNFTGAPTLLQHLWLFQVLTSAGRLLGGSFLNFDKNINRLCNENNNLSALRRIRIIHRLWYFQIASLSFGSLYSLDFISHQEVLRSFDKIIYAFTFSAIFLTVVFQTHINMHSNILCLYVNSLLLHMKKFPSVTCVPFALNKSLKFTKLINLLLAYAIVPTCSSVPVAIVLGYFWRCLCNPGFPGYFLVPECWKHGGSPIR